jgi:hypothetical protein
MAEQLSISINLNGTEQVVTSIGQVKKALKEAEFQALALEEQFGAGSPQVIALRKNIELLRDKVGDAADATKSFAEGGLFTTAGKALAGVAGGFSAIQGAIGLVGVESKDLEKTLLKVQSAMALSQGIESVIQAKDSFVNLGNKIKDSSAFIKANELATKGAALATRLFGGAVDTTAVSFKVLKGAIAATGIGLLVVAIGFLVEKLMTMGKSSKEAADKQKELNKELANTTKEVVKQSEKFIESDTKLKVARAKLAGASEKELLEIEKQGINAKIEVRQRNYEDLLKTDKIAASDLAQQNADAQDEIILADLAFQQKQKELREEANKKKKEEEEAEDKRILEGKEKARKAGFDFDMLVLDKQEKDKEEKAKKDKEDEEADNAAMEAIGEKNEKELNAQIEANNKKILAQKEYNKLVIEAEQEVQDAKFGVASAGLNLLGSLVGQNEKIGNAIFVADKALAVAKIITNTIGEISGYALANSKFGVAGGVLTAKMALGAKLRAAAGIATIAATTISKFKGGSTSSNFGSGGAISTSGVPIVPQQNQTQTTNISQQSINDLGNQAIKAYVVETDVTSSQQRIAAIQQRARFN